MLSHVNAAFCVSSLCVFHLGFLAYFLPINQEQMKLDPAFLSGSITLLNHLKNILTRQSRQSQVECTIIFFPCGFALSVKLWIPDPSSSPIAVDSALHSSLLNCCCFCAPEDISRTQDHAAFGLGQFRLLTGFVSWMSHASFLPTTPIYLYTFSGVISLV